MDTKFARESLRELRVENQRLSHALQVAQDRLSAAEQRADTATKSATDAWQFARLALRTGRSVAHE